MHTQNLREKREVEDIKKNIHLQSKKLQAQNEKIIANEVEVTNLESRVLNLEENTSSGGSDDLSEVAVTGKYNDLIGRPDEFFEMGTSFKSSFVQNWGVERKSLRTKDFWFSCAVDSVIEGSVKIEYKGSRKISTMDDNLQFLLNNEVLCEENFTSLSSSLNNKVFEFKIRPKKAINSFAVNFTKLSTWGGEFVICSIQVDITYGKNVFFLTRSFDWYATVYKDKYLITKNEYPNIQLYLKNKDDFDFSVSYESLDGTIGKCLIPSFSPYYPSGKPHIEMSYDDILLTGYSSYGDYPKVSIYDTNINQKLLSPEMLHAYSITYFRHIAIDYSCPAMAVVGGEDRKLGFFESPEHQGILYYTLNGLPLESGVWIENSAVMKQDMDGVVTRNYRGSVGMKYNGECIFFPQIHSTYCVPLGFGRRVNVFLQDNDNIHVYLGRQNHVVKKVLIKNAETNQYEIDSTQEIRINGYDEIVETLDGCFIGLNDDGPELVSWNEVL